MRPLVYLVGANMRDRESICHTARGELVPVEPVASVVELKPDVLANVDVFLAWDAGETIAQLKAHLSILAHRAPIVAIAQRPTVRQVVNALVSGAIDYLEWPCSSAELLEAVSSAANSTARLIPLRQRAVDARSILRKLCQRERQVLTAMAQGMSNKSIAELLDISPRDVEMHRRDLLAKLEVKHSAEAIRLELEASLAVDSNRRSDWMAPWLFDQSLARIC